MRKITTRERGRSRNDGKESQTNEKRGLRRERVEVAEVHLGELRFHNVGAFELFCWVKKRNSLKTADASVRRHMRRVAGATNHL